MDTTEYEMLERVINAIEGVTAAIEKMNARLEARDRDNIEVVEERLTAMFGTQPSLPEDLNDLVEYVPLVSGHPFTGDGEGNDFCTHVMSYTEQETPDDIPRPVPCGFPKESHG